MGDLGAKSQAGTQDLTVAESAIPSTPTALANPRISST
jgi:hypothetical protein